MVYIIYIMVLLYSSYRGKQRGSGMVFPDAPCALGFKECLLCLDSASSSRVYNSDLPSWESVWNEKCAESICKLLGLEVDTFKPFFLSGDYCPTCKQMTRDVDYFITTVDAFQERLSKFRTKVSTFLHKNIDIWIHKTNVPIPSFQSEAHSSTSSNNILSRGSSISDSLPLPIGIHTQQKLIYRMK